MMVWLHDERPYLSTGFRESQLLLVNNDFGIGYANTNMWWGPGLHNSLHMSNNTSGFNYLFLGTTSEKRVSFLVIILNIFFLN